MNCKPIVFGYTHPDANITINCYKADATDVAKTIYDFVKKGEKN